MPSDTSIMNLTIIGRLDEKSLAHRFARADDLGLLWKSACGAVTAEPNAEDWIIESPAVSCIGCLRVMAGPPTSDIRTTELSPQSGIDMSAQRLMFIRNEALKEYVVSEMTTD